MTTWQAEPLPLFQTPEWARVIGVFDLETTGVDVERDRIVTAHVGVLDVDGNVIDARDWLADPGIDIPAGAAAIHGITTERARADGAPAPRVVSEVVEALGALFAAGIPVVAYNAPFDFSLLKNEAVRHGVAPIHAPSPVIDPLVVDKTYDRYRRGKRTLSVVASTTPSRSIPPTKPAPTRSQPVAWPSLSPRSSDPGCRRPSTNCTPVRSRGLARRPRA